MQRQHHKNPTAFGMDWREALDKQAGEGKKAKSKTYKRGFRPEIDVEKGRAKYPPKNWRRKQKRRRKIAKASRQRNRKTGHSRR